MSSLVRGKQFPSCAVRVHYEYAVLTAAGWNKRDSIPGPMARGSTGCTGDKNEWQDSGPDWFQCRIPMRSAVVGFELMRRVQETPAVCQTASHGAKNALSRL